VKKSSVGKSPTLVNNRHTVDFKSLSVGVKGMIFDSFGQTHAQRPGIIAKWWNGFGSFSKIPW